MKKILLLAALLSVVLNVCSAQDSNMAREVVGPPESSLPCATLMYALPGAQYIHKLVTHEGETVTRVDFEDIEGLSLKDDRASMGNRYKYVSGIAPTQEGEYVYVVHLTNAEGKASQVRVRLIVNSHLQSPTPKMAWLTWNWFAHEISHDKMVAIAQGMQKHGLVDAGFSTIVLDDAWATPTSDKWALTYDPAKFPQGISGLKTALKQVNSKLKLGIYSDAGAMTCENCQPGSYLYEAEHLALFDSWGVDMLKYDYCNSEASTQVSYGRMGDAVAKLNETRKANGQIPFVLNICEWGKTQPWLWGAEAGGSSWRATSDAREDWIGDNSRPGVIAGVDETRRLWMYAGVNRFNDLDMMCIGLHGLGDPSNNTMNHKMNGGKIPGLTDAQARTQMSLWCMLASPLSLTCDLREHPQAEANRGQTMPDPLITPADVETLTNREILAINQDALGQQAEYMEMLSTGGTDYSTTGYDVYVKDLTGGRFAVSVTNRDTLSVQVPALQLTDLYMKAGTKYTSREVWSKNQEVIENTLAVGTLQACETKVYVLTPVRETHNPVFDGWYADPEVICYDDTYWIYPTSSNGAQKATYFDAFSSKDLKNWKRHACILDTATVSWAWKAMWAPSVLKKDNKYYLFFSANDIHQGETGGIGVAWSDCPEGPYTDRLGKPLISDIVNGAQPIDQFVFRDGNDYYMYYGGWGHCNVVRLKEDFTGLLPFEDGSLYKEITPEQYVEGPFLFKKDNRYYFMWSEGAWHADDYSVAYAIADSPFGPFKRIGKILEQNPEIGTGAGHHSVLHREANDEWYIVYHRHPLGDKVGTHRQVCIDRMFFDANGKIMPVVMTK